MSSAAYQRARARVIERDGACVRCGATERLSAHHVVPAVECEDPTDEANMLTLCLRCHGRADGGRSHGGRGGRRGGGSSRERGHFPGLRISLRRPKMRNPFLETVA
jgi:5-methylcytosine-specific restriction endonuclease McrA